jgi:hypothetical protein
LLLIGDSFMQAGIETFASDSDALNTRNPQRLLEITPAQCDALDPGMLVDCAWQVVECAIELVEQWEESAHNLRARSTRRL